MINQRYSRIVVIVSCVLIGGSFLYTVVGMRSRFGAPPAPPVFVSTDDGASYFTLGTSGFPPFEVKGQEADEAVLFADADHKPFVGYLRKYPAEVQSVLTSAERADPRWRAAWLHGALVKPPRVGKWVGEDNPAYESIVHPRDPKTQQPAYAY